MTSRRRWGAAGRADDSGAVIGRVRRNTELGLIVLASVIVVSAYVLASLGQNASIPANIVPFLGVVLGLLVLAHVATRRLAPFADPLLLPLAALLNGLGYVMIARLSGEPNINGDLAGLQSTWTAIGIGAYVGTLVFVDRARTLDRYRYTVGAVGLGLLLVPLMPIIGREINGARIWASIGPINFQPGEFAKLALAVFFASYLVDKRELLRVATFRVGPFWLPEPKHLAPILAAWLGSLVIMVAEKDLGSSLLFFAVFVVMLWVATERLWYLLISGALFSAGAILAWSRFSHVQRRVDTWLDPWADSRDSGFQVTESLFALADGGLTGKGLGLGSASRIPEVENDFIFAALGEELGLFGTTAILLTYLLIVGSGLRIAILAENSFEKILAVGLSALIGIQAFIIIGGVIRVVPLTGITLPFVSYGGSSLLANYVILALLIRISDQTARRLRAQEEQAREAVS